MRAGRFSIGCPGQVAPGVALHWGWFRLTLAIPPDRSTTNFNLSQPARPGAPERPRMTSNHPARPIAADIQNTPSFFLFFPPPPPLTKDNDRARVQQERRRGPNRRRGFAESRGCAAHAT